jgi:pyruvate-ferredoxin/flavodoxin oxidoreductase
MAKMAEGFKAIRIAELELNGEYEPARHDAFFARFDWRQFSDAEFQLCPPVVSIGGDGAMYDIGFQNLSRMLMTGMPIKVLVLDTQVYSNTGGQACTSGFLAQVSDMAPFGSARKGKSEIRKEMGLIGLAHRTAYVMQGSIANVTHLIESYIEGLNSRRPAVFNVYAVCQTEHGVADDTAARQSKLALEGRAYPLFRYNPDKGPTLKECTDLDGNPAVEADWPTYKLGYLDENGNAASMELPLTFADFAFSEGRFRKHFRPAPRELGDDNLVPLNEYLDLPEDQHKGRFPFLWAVDKHNHLTRVLVAPEMVRACAERRGFWRLLKSLAGNGIDADAIAAAARNEMAQQLEAAIHSITGDAHAGATGAAPAGAALPAMAGAAFEPVWIETPECTTCDECTTINPHIFAYNDEDKAVVRDPRGGPFRDIVRAAEKCTGRIIHPGTPANPNEPGLDQLIQRAAKYQ